MRKKKSLGQHFLTSPHYLALIADTAAITKGELVLEVGPGDGALTEALLARGAHVVAVEKDHRLIPLLTERFSHAIAEERLFVREGDILALSAQTLQLTPPYALVANIPYYITGALLEQFLTEKEQPAHAVLLLQKEVAERIARSSKESILSLSVKAYGVPTYVKTVPAGAFAPPPEVDSAILKIEDISRERFKNKEHEARFFVLLHAGFAKKRKLLKRNLESVLGEKVHEAFIAANIPEKARAEDVPLKAWLTLATF